ncbi:MAG: hypothetical protein OJF52_002177 [Nitrospira sp.]|nr:MAG: hypothetical protein OJF52_002177 [Nitrospira sp.]
MAPSIYTDVNRRLLSGRIDIVCRTYQEGPVIILGTDRTSETTTTSGRMLSIHQRVRSAGARSPENRAVGIIVPEGRCRPVRSISGSFDIAMALKTVVDVLLQGKNIPAMRVSFLYSMPGPLFTGGHILLQASGPFHRMLPYRPATACHHPHTDCAQQNCASYQEGGCAQPYPLVAGCPKSACDVETVRRNGGTSLTMSMEAVRSNGFSSLDGSNGGGSLADRTTVRIGRSNSCQDR